MSLVWIWKACWPLNGTYMPTFVYYQLGKWKLQASIGCVVRLMCMWRIFTHSLLKTLLFLKYGIVCRALHCFKQHQCANVLAKTLHHLKKWCHQIGSMCLYRLIIAVIREHQNESTWTYHMRKCMRKNESFTNLCAHTVREIGAKTTFKSSFVEWLNYPLCALFLALCISDETNEKWTA